jgi:hypothetical protein
VHFTCVAHSCSDLSWLELFVLSFLCRFALLVSSRINRSILFSLCACAVFSSPFFSSSRRPYFSARSPRQWMLLWFFIASAQSLARACSPIFIFLVARQGRTRRIRRLAPDFLFPCLISVFYRPWRLGEHTIDQSQNPRLCLSCACWSRLEYLWR